jgi:CheY-like chemotaxis protein
VGGCTSFSLPTPPNKAGALRLNNPPTPVILKLDIVHAPGAVTREFRSSDLWKGHEIILMRGRALMLDNKTGLLPKVMLVDDDEDVREIVGETLKSQRFDVQVCGSGRQAINSLTDDIRLVILDMMMPDMDGMETFLEIKKRQPGVPIVFYSAFRNMLDPTRLKPYEPVGFIEKGMPGSRQRLVELVKSLITV